MSVQWLTPTSLHLFIGCRDSYGIFLYVAKLHCKVYIAVVQSVYLSITVVDCDKTVEH